MTTAPRVRFAPAPTGYLHVGGARSALFNWLYARKTGGTFVLRIEDTNAALKEDGMVDAILDTMRWLGLDWDEGPYFQSDRLDRYLDAIAQLLDQGKAYYCDCPRSDIDARAKERGGPPGYDGYCRNRGVADGEGVVIRFRTPDEGVTVIDDVVRGTVEFANADIEDFVVRRSNGSPVFLVANAYDDHDMGITHAVRGEDLLNTTPKVMLLWEALGYGPPPVYAHLPLLVNEARKKLSKRRDDVSVGDYKDKGYLPEAMVNYLATLGWGAPDGVEIRPIEEIVETFSLEDVNKAPAFFDLKKLDHFNSTYIRALDPAEFVTRSEKWLTSDAPWTAESYDSEVMAAVAPLVQERVRTLAEVPNMVDWLFLDEPPVDEAAWKKVMGKADVPAVLDGALVELESCPWDADSIEVAVRAVGDRIGAKSQVPVRVAVTGRRVGPPLFEPMALLDRSQVLRRLQAARDRL